MTITEKNIIVGIRKRIKRGDMKGIAAKSGYSREHVSNSLNPDNDIYIEKIVVAAIEYLKEKEAEKVKLLNTISELDANE